MKKSTKIILFAAICCAVATTGIVIAVQSKRSSSQDVVYVSKVAEVTGQTGGRVNRFSGVVEVQDTVNINKDSAKTVSELYVTVGQAVDAGTQLFKYDVTDATNNIASANLEIEGLNNEIDALNSDIADLTKQKVSASADDQLDYTLQIQNKQMSVRQNEYSKQSKQTDITKYQHEIDNAVVVSTTAGTIKAINKTGTDSSGSVLPYIQITQSGDYRVKGTLDESTISSIVVNQNVIIRSRVDENQIWNGTVTSIETKPETSTSTNVVVNDSSSSGEKTSKYPFYVSLKSTKGLMLGQHIYIEPDNGQSSVKDGIWLDASYIVQDGDTAYVWGAVNGKLKKITVELGQQDKDTNAYEIKSGLKMEDEIAWPMDNYQEGVNVTEVSATNTTGKVTSAQGVSGS
jgi:Membrane-fusion protein